MADVQCENGYTWIANEILEHMAKIKLSPTQYRLLFVIWRFTYGFSRKEHDMSLTFLSNATGCDKRQIQRELKGLEDKHIIYQNIANGKFRKISFNKNYESWIGENTIGETTIGETTIGEIDNGETINATIGETVNGGVGETINATIGETVNQERKKENFKENIKEKASKSKNDYSKQFESWWEEYPRKKDKKKAYTSFQTAIKKYSFEMLLNGLRGYKDEIKKNGTLEKYIKHPTSFLNGESFKDYQPKKKEQKPSGNKIDQTLLRKLKRIDELVDLMEQAQDDETFHLYEQERNQLKEEVNMVG
jgi:phage replication O-like protein O